MTPSRFIVEYDVSPPFQIPLPPLDDSEALSGEPLPDILQTEVGSGVVVLPGLQFHEDFLRNCLRSDLE